MLETRKYLDEEQWLYVETKEFSPTRYFTRITHEGMHRFKDGQCPCGVLDLGIVE